MKRRGARKRGARARRSVRVNPIPRPEPNPSSADVAERGVASIGVRSSENLHIINKKKSFSGDVNYEANFSFFILLHKRANVGIIPR